MDLTNGAISYRDVTSPAEVARLKRAGYKEVKAVATDEGKLEAKSLEVKLEAVGPETVEAPAIEEKKPKADKPRAQSKK